MTARRINIVRKVSISAEQTARQIDSSFDRDLPRFHNMAGLGSFGGPVAIIGGGPSLNNEMENLRTFKGTKIGCGSVHDHLIDHGIIPDYVVLLDWHEVVCEFIKKPHPDITYLVASHCHPDVFDRLRDYKVLVWHATLLDIEDNVALGDSRGEPQIGGGDSVVLRAWPIAGVMGFRDIHFFGFDLSFPKECEDQHAYSYSGPHLTREEPVGMVVQQTGERFITCAGWMRQLDDFHKMLSATAGQFEITIHGDGLVASTFCKGLAKGGPERFKEGVDQLLRGDYIRGFANCEYRQGLRGGAGKVPLPASKEWNGEPLIGKTLLLHAEGGHGDTIMMLRYVQTLVECGAKVLMVVQPKLRSLAARMDNVHVISHAPASWPHYDCWASMLSLPYRFATTVDIVPPPSCPSLDAAEAKRFGAMIGRDGLRVGLCWKSHPNGDLTDYKSMPSEAIRPLLDLHGTKFFSLQVPHEVVDGVRHLPLDTFLDTAHAIINLDLVITVDTAVAHLAASMGKPTWVILPREDVSWPWMAGGDHSPWYPKARLFRVGKDEKDWSDVVRRVRDALVEYAANKPSGIQEIQCDVEMNGKKASFRMRLDMGQGTDLVIANVHLGGMCYEPEIVDVMTRILRPGDLFVDVGANVGYFTLLAASLGCEVIALEPTPETCARLRANVRLNGFGDRVKVVEAAAWHEPGSIRFFVNEDGNNGGNAAWGDWKKQDVIDVRAITLADLLEGRQARMMKVDTEGAECNVICGLRSNAPAEYVTCEVHEHALSQLGHSVEDLRSRLPLYESFALYYDGSYPRMVPRNTRMTSDQICNYLFTTTDRVGDAWPVHDHNPWAKGN